MVKKNPPVESAFKVLPKTRGQQESHKQKGFITGFFRPSAGFQKGWPPKLSVTPTVSTTKANTGMTKSKTNTTDLDVAVHNEQQQMMNLTPQDMFMGYIIEHSVGEKANRRLAKRTVDMISGGVASYSRCLTSSANMKSVQETYDVAAGMAILTEEKNNEKKYDQKTNE